MARFFKSRGKKRFKKRRMGIMSIPRGPKVNPDKFSTKFHFTGAFKMDGTTAGKATFIIKMYDPLNVMYTQTTGGSNTAITDQYGGGAACSEWTIYNKLFDLCKVNAIKVNYIPCINIASASGPSSLIYQINTWYDLDNAIDNPTVVNVDTTTTQLGAANLGAGFFQNYASLKQYTMGGTNEKGFKRYIKLPKQVMQSSTFSAINVNYNGYRNSTSSPNNGLFYMHLFDFDTTPFAVNQKLGQVNITYYVSFKKRV